MIRRQDGDFQDALDQLSIWTSAQFACPNEVWIAAGPPANDASICR